MTASWRHTGSQKPRQNRTFRRNRPLQAIAAGYALLWVLAAIEPYNRFDWLLENVLVFVGVGIILVSYRAAPLSNLSYGLIALFLAMHIVGSHYTYSLAPPGFWLGDALDLDRNHYDRVVHFCFGLLLAYPVRETLARAVTLSGYWPAVLVFALLVAASNLYEMIEWAAAEVISPEAAMAFLGTQGDDFDAQKDTAMAAAGAIVGLAATAALQQIHSRRPVPRAKRRPLRWLGVGRIDHGDDRPSRAGR